MNEREAMSFKALLRRIAAEENIPAQVVLQNFVFEESFQLVRVTFMMFYCWLRIVSQIKKFSELH